ncbi:IPT/TIG domain-containing protein [Chitinophaga sp. MM2321]|uniref:IPT/TIG domain-containing protein n=1 Tax=Chitinophaga sp. MM2321 TaxID=3137178 RepID=UPI0032D5A54B
MRNILCCLLLMAGVVLSSCQKDHETAAVKGLVITSIWPASGIPATIVTINGKNFSGVRENNTVKFNGVQAIVIEASATQLQVVSPANGTSGNVTVTVNSQEAVGPSFAYTAPPEEYMVSTFAGEGTSGSVEGSFAMARFKNPEGITIDAQGNFIVTDRGNNRIRKLGTNGMVSAIAGKDAGGFKDGDASVALFKLPWRAAVDAQGNMYVADRDNHRIRKITPAGVVSTFAGTGTAGFEDGPAATAKFNQPIDITLDPAGNLYVADNLNHRIRKIATDGSVSTVAGDGTAGFADGTGTAAKLRNPSGIDMDKDGNLVVADRTNHRIRMIAPDGVVTTIAGDGVSGYKDGAAAAARFADPYGITVDHAGNIIVADLSNNKIRKITAEGIVSTVAGTSNGFANGAGGGAQFSQPTDVCVDADDNIYVADLGNHRIRKISLK